MAVKCRDNEIGDATDTLYELVLHTGEGLVDGWAEGGCGLLLLRCQHAFFAHRLDGLHLGCQNGVVFKHCIGISGSIIVVAFARFAIVAMPMALMCHRDNWTLLSRRRTGRLS